MLRRIGISGGTLAALAVVGTYLAIVVWNDDGATRVSESCKKTTTGQFNDVLDHELAIRGIEGARVRIGEGEQDGEPVVVFRAEYDHSGHTYELLGTAFDDPCKLLVKPFGRPWMKY